VEGRRSARIWRTEAGILVHTREGLASREQQRRDPQWWTHLRNHDKAVGEKK
jgi:hypothetical protein